VGLAAAMLAAAPLQPPAPPGDEPPAQRRREGQEPRAETREQLTARLQSRLERIRADEERVTKALEALAAGKPVEDEAVREGADVGRGRRGDGRGPGGPGGRERPNGGPPIDRDAVLAFIQEHMPEIHERFEALKASDPRAYEGLIRGIERRVHDIMGERDPEMRSARIAEFRHGARVFAASRRYGELVRRGAPEAELSAAREELRPLLAEQFDLRLKIKQLEIVALERQLAKLNADVEGQSANRDKAVEDGLVRIEKFSREHGERPPPPR
jgi:hypothetical protein